MANPHTVCNPKAYPDYPCPECGGDAPRLHRNAICQDCKAKKEAKREAAKDALQNPPPEERRSTQARKRSRARIKASTPATPWAKILATCG